LSSFANICRKELRNRATSSHTSSSHDAKDSECYAKELDY
jgi:hypothetical protein